MPNHNRPQDKYADNMLYQSTCALLQGYRDKVWGLELSIRQAQTRFALQYNGSADAFLNALEEADAALPDDELEKCASSIRHSRQLLKLLDNAVDLMRRKHKNGEVYYWLLYYAFLSPQQPRSADEVIEKLRSHIQDISTRTYYRRRKEAISVLSSILWSCSSPDSANILREFSLLSKYDM